MILPDDSNPGFPESSIAGQVPPIGPAPAASEPSELELRLSSIKDAFLRDCENQGSSHDRIKHMRQASRACEMVSDSCLRISYDRLNPLHRNLAYLKTAAQTAFGLTRKQKDRTAMMPALDELLSELERATSSVFRMTKRGDLGAALLKWDDTVSRPYAAHFEVPIDYSLSCFRAILSQFRVEIALYPSDAVSARDLDAVVKVQQEYRTHILPGMEAELVATRKEYEEACRTLQEPTGDPIAKYRDVVVALSKVRYRSQACNGAIRVLAEVMLTLPKTIPGKHASRYASLLKNLNTDLSRMRAIARESFFYDLPAARKQRLEQEEGFQRVLSLMTPEQIQAIDLPESTEILYALNDSRERLRHREFQTMFDDYEANQKVEPVPSHVHPRVRRSHLAYLALLSGLGVQVLAQMSLNEQIETLHQRTWDAMNKNTLTPLHAAIQLEDADDAYENTHALLAMGMNADWPNPAGETPLEIAFHRYESGEQAGQRMIVDLFFAGAKIIPSNARVAFQLAIDTDRNSRLHALEKISSEFLQDFERNGNSLLVNFIRHDATLGEIRAAIAKGASLEATLGGATPVLVAALQGKTAIVRLLWECGADALVQGPDGRTALAVMKLSSDSDMRDLASEIEGSETPSPRITTELHRLVTTASAQEVLGYILASGADVNVWNENGDSPLDLVLQDAGWNIEMVSVLLNAGATIRYSNFQPSLWQGLRNWWEGKSPPSAIERLVTKHMEAPRLITHDHLSRTEQETTSQKVLSHAFEKAEFIQVYGELTFNAEGGLSPLFAAEMLPSFDAFNEQYAGLLGDSEISVVRSILTSGLAIASSVGELREFIRKVTETKEIAHAHSGYAGHAIELFFLPWPTTTYLVVNNKGALSRRPVEIYQIDPTKVTLQNVLDLHLLPTRDRDYYSRWMESFLVEIDAQPTPLTSRIENAYPGERVQKVGNCAWESVETAVWPALALGRLTAPHPQALWPWAVDPVERELQSVANVFSQWLAYTKLFVAEKYLDSHSEPSMQVAIPMDRRVMGEVFADLQDAVGILPDGQERFTEAEARYKALLGQEELLGYRMHSVWARTFAAGLKEQRSNPRRALAAAVRAV